MIITELYNGQGLGNQLWCYAVTRVIAQKNGYDFGIMSRNKFKGSDFLELDFGKEVVGDNWELVNDYGSDVLLKNKIL